MEILLNIKKEILKDFFLYLFPKRETRHGKEFVVISRTNEVGLLLCCLWSRRDPSYKYIPTDNSDALALNLPDFYTIEGGRLITSNRLLGEPADEFPDSLALRLPFSVGTLEANTHFVHYTIRAECRIQDCLQAMFDLDFKKFVLDCMEIGMTRKDTTNKYIIDRNLVSLQDDNEMLLKRHYRQNLQRYERYASYLTERAAYFDKKMKKSSNIFSINQQENNT